MFRDLYVEELDYLYALGDEVGKAHARIAPLVGRGADPSMTRLVQSVAFLTARLRQRLDDDLPEVVHPIVESNAPWLLAPIPSAAVLELTPEASLKETSTVRAGSPFASRPVDGAPCLFRSGEDCVVRPWSLSAVDVGAEGAELRLTLRPNDGAALGALEGWLRVHLAGPLAEALDLRARILHGARAIVARVGDRAVPLQVRAVAPKPLLGDAPGDACHAMRAYLTWPESFAFVEIGPLDACGALPADSSMSLEVRFREPLPRRAAIDTDRVRLHAVVVANVHRPQTVSVDYVRGRSILRWPRAGAQLASIERVTLVRRDLTTLGAEPFARFFPPVVDPGGREPLLYRVERTCSPLGQDVDVALSFHGDAALDDVTTVDVEVALTDGQRAAGVGVGDIRVPVSGSPSIVSFRNVTAVSRAAPPPIESGRLWEWLHLRKVSLPQLLDRATLARALAVMNTAAALRWPGAKPSGDAFEPLRDVAWTRSTRALDGGVFLGAQVVVTIDPEGFDGAGDVALFAERLAELLAGAIREHEWLELALRDEGGVTLAQVGPLFGTREGT